MAMSYTEVQAKSVVNAIPHSKFSVSKGLSCRQSMNTSLGCATSCSYCYIRYLTRWKGMGPNEIFQRISIRTNVAEVLDRELTNRRKEWLWIGSTADPYQAFEERYQLMRGVLQVLADHQYPYEIITKGGSLVTRDTDLLALTRDVGLVSLSLFSSLDDEKRKMIELKASPVQERIRALETLNKAGVRTMALLLPILPGYSDDLAEIRQLLQAVRTAGTTRLYAGLMRLYPITWVGMKNMMPRKIWELRDRYQALYFGPVRSISAGARVPDLAYRRELMRNISQIAREEGFTQFLCEENFFDLWFGPQDEHAGFRYAIHYDFYLERQQHGGRPLTRDEATSVAKRFHHTPPYLRSVEANLDMLNQLTASGNETMR